MLLVVMFALHVCAYADRGGFYYTHFDVSATVHKNNVWDITETMEVYFTEPRHGIYRYIPRTFSLKHDVSQDEGMHPQKVDGEVVQDLRTFKYVSEIDHLEVPDWPYSTDDSTDEFLVIRMGSASQEVTGHQRYVVRYQYTYQDDRRPAFDYLFHTVLGTDFDESIEHFSFRIEFEKPLPADIAERLEVYSGACGQLSNSIEGLTVKATPKVITGAAENVRPNHGVTLYAKLPADYYEGTKTVSHWWHYLFLVLTVVFIAWIVMGLLTVKRGLLTKVIEFYPPEGVSSAEVGVIIDEKVDEEDIASLIPWLAGQGYIHIREVAEKRFLLGTDKDLELTKLKDLPKNAPSYQKRMMKLLFPGSRETVRLKELGEQPATMEAIKNALSKYFTGKKALTHTSPKIWLYALLWASTTLLFSTNSVLRAFDLAEILFAVLFWSLPFAIGVIWRFYTSGGDMVERAWKRIFWFLVRAVAMAVVCYSYCEWIPEYGAPMPKWLMVTLFVICFVLCELAPRFKVNTDYRLQMMGRLLGFKEFIQTAEKSRLEALQAEDPQYYYKVLPYAMVFKLTNKWTKLFKDIDVQQPEWYETTQPLMGYALTSHMTSRLMSSTSTAIRVVSHDSSSASSDSFSSGGGGGFSGGGGGGGGGGSW